MLSRPFAFFAQKVTNEGLAQGFGTLVQVGVMTGMEIANHQNKLNKENSNHGNIQQKMPPSSLPRSFKK